VSGLPTMNGVGDSSTSASTNGHRGTYGHCQLNGNIIYMQITHKHTSFVCFCVLRFYACIICCWTEFPASRPTNSVNALKAESEVQPTGCLGGAVVGHRTRNRNVTSSTPSRGAIKSTRSTQHSIPQWG